VDDRRRGHVAPIESCRRRRCLAARERWVSSGAPVRARHAGIGCGIPSGFLIDVTTNGGRRARRGRPGSARRSG
jgi:hypothetical protein